MKRILLVTAVLLASQQARAQCPSYTTCSFAPVMGQQPTTVELNALMEEVAQNTLGDRGPTLPQMEAGPTRTRGAPRFPCALFKAVGVIESNWRQFCADTGLTVISFDCGFGISQITSGAAGFGSRIASEPAYNLGAGAQIYIGKWNGETTYGGKINSSTPTVVEDWYYATWAYNGFSIKNNPNNASYPGNRPPYGGTGGLSRGNYPYQELVWGRVRNPLKLNGENAYNPVEVSYPDNADIPAPPASGSHLFQADLTINPQHDNPCLDPCANGGCPAVTELIVDNLDPGFTLSGAAEDAATGGFRDTFRHTLAVAEGAATVTGLFTPVLPSDGIWEISAWIPLDPADSPNIPVDIGALGGTYTVRMDQSVVGGHWQTLGRAKLRAAHTFVAVRNDTGETDGRVGLDAIRWRWIDHGGNVAAGAVCVDSADCRDSLACLGGVCSAPCFEVACVNSMGCNQQTGLCTEPLPYVDAGPDPVSSSSLGPSSTAFSMAMSAQPQGGGNPPPRDEGPSCPSVCSNSGTMAPLWLVGLWLLIRRRCRRQAARCQGSHADRTPGG